MKAIEINRELNTKLQWWSVSRQRTYKSALSEGQHEHTINSIYTVFQELELNNKLSTVAILRLQGLTKTLKDARDNKFSTYILLNFYFHVKNAKNAVTVQRNIT